MSLLIDRAFLHCLPGGGQRRRFNCPVCYQGSRSEPNTMVLIPNSQVDAVVLYCHRASCPSRNLSSRNGGIRLSSFLRYFRPELYEDYCAAIHAESRGVAPQLPKVPEVPSAPAPDRREPAAAPETLLEFIRVELSSAFSLPADHPARVYVEGRRLPEKHRDVLLWDEAFNHTASLLDGKERRPSARLLIPYLDPSGKKLVAILGRSIKPDVYPKYLAAKVDPAVPLVFGLDRVQADQQIIVCEGPLDSLFLHNAVAVTGTTLTKSAELLPKKQLVLVYDNQPKLADLMIRTAQEGFRVAVWWFQGEEGRKDINELVLAGYTPEKLRAALIRNSFEGPEAIRRIRRWRDL